MNKPSIVWTPTLYKRLRAYAELQGLPVAEAVRQIVERGLATKATRIWDPECKVWVDVVLPKAMVD